MMGGLGASTLWDALWGTYFGAAGLLTLLLRAFALRHAGDAYLVFALDIGPDGDGGGGGGGGGSGDEGGGGALRHRRSARVAPGGTRGEARPLTSAASTDSSPSVDDGVGGIHNRADEAEATVTLVEVPQRA